MEAKEKVTFWAEEAKRSLKVADDLFKLKHYLETLFYCHLALERLLKSKVVEATQKDPLYTHDLVKLAEKAKFKLIDDQVMQLAKINTYNIRTRYQDYKLSLYKQATYEFTKNELAQTKKLFNKLK